MYIYFIMSDKINILIVEDEIKVAETIKSYLEKEGFNASFAILGSAAVNILNEKTFNLIILDLMLPDISGEEICKMVRKTSDVPIIVLTAKSTRYLRVVNVLNTGADDYLIKPVSPRELVARVKAVLRRAGLFSENSAVLYNDGLSIDFTSRTVKKNDTEITLTPNEYKLLKFLAQNAGRYFSREDLIEDSRALRDGYDRAVDSHIKNLRQKIEDNPKNPKYIVTQYGVGYKFAGTKI